MSQVGKNLEPAKFGVKSPGSPRNEFGQTFGQDEDKTGANTPTSESIDHMHRRSDVNSSRKSQHHTLGNGPNQSASGDHIHDGVQGRKLGPLEMDPNNPGSTRPELTIPTGASVTDVVNLLHNFIEFREV